MIIDKEVEVKIGIKNYKYYESCGYTIPRNNRGSIPRGTTIIVNSEDIYEHSHDLVNVECDYCHKVIQMEYRQYYKEIQKYGNIACKGCVSEHCQETMMNKYHVANAFQLEFVKEKIKETNLQRYGCEYISQNPDTKEKIRKTLLEKYGHECIFLTETAKQKNKQRSLEKYGTENPFSSPIFVEKLKHKNMELYGVEWNSQRKEIRDKVNKTLSRNNSICTSSQQIYINNLYNGELNYLCEYYFLDIYIKQDNIDVEVDFGGHDLMVKTGRMTQEEFNKREMIREKIIRSNGIRIMRLVSPHDKLPSDKKLLELYDFAKDYFNSTKHTWIIFYLEKNKYRNAEHLDGQYYDYGQLWDGKILSKQIKEVDDAV